YVESTNFLEKYDAILIDEGQDFAQEWIQSLVKILNPETNSILFCYDPAQNIFNRKRPSWRSFGLEVQGKKPTELMRCYRNTKEILVTARSFLNSKKLDSLVAEDDFDRVLDPDTGECKVGIFPVTYQSQNYQETINLIVKKIKYLVNNGHPENSIAILIARHESQEKLDVLLKKAFEEHASNISYKFIITSNDKKALNLRELNIKILNFESSKGLEFDHVFLIGLENMPRITAKLVRDEDTERKLTYVAMTRAKENLYMISHKDTGYFSEIAEIINSLKPATEIIIKKNKEAEIPIGTNAYQAWTEDEEVRLIDSFMEQGKSVQEISKILERSSGAIRARLKKLKLLE
ncbi:3'-5' exonuclease, partial [Acinetobacter baumannii]|nr:ATP-binding domain-containing protein [Acinetobacter baumannii]